MFDSSPSRIRDEEDRDNREMIDFEVVEEWLGQKEEELDDKGDDAFDKQAELLCAHQHLIISLFIGEDLRTDSRGRVLPYCAACRWLFLL